MALGDASDYLSVKAVFENGPVVAFADAAVNGLERVAQRPEIGLRPGGVIAQDIRQRRSHFAMRMVFGEAQDRIRLDGDYQFWLERQALVFGRDTPARPAGVTPMEWKVAERVQRLDALRGNNVASDGYRRLYALESFATARGGFGTANLHIAETADGRPTIVWKGRGAESALPDFFAVVVGFAVDLVRAVWRKSGLDLDSSVGSHEIGDSDTGCRVAGGRVEVRNEQA